MILKAKGRNVQKAVKVVALRPKGQVEIRIKVQTQREDKAVRIENLKNHLHIGVGKKRRVDPHQKKK